MQRSILPFTALLGLLAILLTGHSSAAVRGTDDKPAKVAVTIDNFSFGPNAITVAQGATVEWTNKDDVPHNIISNDKLFGSPVLDSGQKFEFTFKKAGTFSYYCSIHPKMTGKVVVQ